MKEMRKDLREFMSIKMNPLDCLIDLLRTFVVKFEEVNESDIQFKKREGYDVLYHSLPKYLKNELNESSIEIGINKELLMFMV